MILAIKIILGICFIGIFGSIMFAISSAIMLKIIYLDEETHEGSVKCKDCRYSKTKSFITTAIVTKDDETYVQSCMGCGKEKIFLNVWTDKLDSTIERNKNCHCPKYRRKWWKVWVSQKTSPIN